MKITANTVNQKYVSKSLTGIVYLKIVMNSILLWKKKSKVIFYILHRGNRSKIIPGKYEDI